MRRQGRTSPTGCSTRASAAASGTGGQTRRSRGSGLSQRADSRPTKLSGGSGSGLRSRAPSSGHPAIVLADEPTGNLDSATGASIVELIRELNADGATIIMITHDAGPRRRVASADPVLDGAVVSDLAPGRGGVSRRLRGARRRRPGARRLAPGGECRAALEAAASRPSALGIAIGTAAIVGVLGLSLVIASRVDRRDQPARHEPAARSRPDRAYRWPRPSFPARRRRGSRSWTTSGSVAHTALLQNSVRLPELASSRSARPAGLQVRATSLNLLSVLGTGLARGGWLNEGTAREPVAVLGSVAARNNSASTGSTPISGSGWRPVVQPRGHPATLAARRRTSTSAP